MNNRDEPLLGNQTKIVEDLSAKQLPACSVAVEDEAAVKALIHESETTVCLRNVVVCILLVVATVLAFSLIAKLRETYKQLDSNGILTYREISRNIEQNTRTSNRWYAFNDAGWHMFDIYRPTEHNFRITMLLYRRAISEADGQTYGECRHAITLWNMAYCYRCFATRSAKPMTRDYNLLLHAAEYMRLAEKCEETAHGLYHEHVVETIVTAYHDSPSMLRKALRINLLISPCSSSTVDVLRRLSLSDSINSEKYKAQEDLVQDLIDRGVSSDISDNLYILEVQAEGFEAAGKLDKAIDLYKELAISLESKFGSKSLPLMKIKIRLVGLLRRVGRVAEAASFAKQIEPLQRYWRHRLPNLSPGEL